MNRKQLRRAICGSAVILTLGGGLLSQASGEGFISRLWDKRPKLSESRLNPRNWFGGESNNGSAHADLKPVVAVRPELTRNPFAADTTLPASSDSAQSIEAPAEKDAANTAAVPAVAQKQAVPTATEQSTDLPVIAPAKTHAQAIAKNDQPAPSIDSIFRRPSKEMVEQARRRKQGVAADVAAAETPVSDTLVAKAEAKPSVSEVAESTAELSVPPRKTLLRMPTPTPTQRPQVVAELKAGHVALGALASDEAAAEIEKGCIHLEDSVSDQAALSANTAAASAASIGAAATRAADSRDVSEPQSAYERLLAQVKSASRESASPDSSLTRSAPRLPDSLDVSSFTATETGSEIGEQQPVSAANTASSATPAEAVLSQAGSTDSASSDAQSRSIDEMIARSRAEMNRTFLARQAELERQNQQDPGASVGGSQLGTSVDHSAVSQAGATNAGAAPPLMVPQGFNASGFRTYGESSRTVESQPVVQTETPDAANLSAAAAPGGLSRIEQAVRSARQKGTGPTITPGRAGSGIVIDGGQYSVVKPRVTSNAAPSLSVPDQSTFRRLSYERRGDELASQVERLADADGPGPILIAPGEELPRAEIPVATHSEPADVAVETSVASVGSPIDWPDDEDLEPVKPKSGGTSWGLVIFCLALLTAGTHISVRRFRQFRTADAAVKS